MIAAGMPPLPLFFERLDLVRLFVATPSILGGGFISPA